MSLSVALSLTSTSTFLFPTKTVQPLQPPQQSAPNSSVTEVLRQASDINLPMLAAPLVGAATTLLSLKRGIPYAQILGSAVNFGSALFLSRALNPLPNAPLSLDLTVSAVNCLAFKLSGKLTQGVKPQWRFWAPLLGLGLAHWGEEKLGARSEQSGLNFCGDLALAFAGWTAHKWAFETLLSPIFQRNVALAFAGMGAPGSGGRATTSAQPRAALPSSVHAGLTVYWPQAKMPQQPRGLVTLFAGAATNPTCYAGSEKQIVDAGYKVGMPVFPGHENLKDPRYVQGGGRKAWDLADTWENAAKNGLAQVIENHRQEHPSTPIILGGFSMGGAATLLAYENLSDQLRASVSALILAAPALELRQQSSFTYPLLRRVLVPSLAMLGVKARRTSTDHLSAKAEVAMEYSYSSILGAVLLIERGQQSLERLAIKRNLPSTLLVHSGDADPTVAVTAASIAKLNQACRGQLLPILVPPRNGHYVFSGRHPTVDYTVVEYIKYISKHGSLQNLLEPPAANKV